MYTNKKKCRYLHTHTHTHKEEETFSGFKIRRKEKHHMREPRSCKI